MANNTNSDVFKPDSQIFQQNKCGKGNSDARKFWSWCAETTMVEPMQTKCDGLKGGSGICDVSLFIENERDLSYKEICDVGGKPVYQETTAKLEPKEYEKIKEYCKKTLLSLDVLPLWLVILIVIIVLMAVAIASFLFWRYWLRKNLYPSQYDATASTLDSQLTTTPESTAPPVKPDGGLKAPESRSQPKQKGFERITSGRAPIESSTGPRNGASTGTTFRSSALSTSGSTPAIAKTSSATPGSIPGTSRGSAPSRNPAAGNRKRIA